MEALGHDRSEPQETGDHGAKYKPKVPFHSVKPLGDRFRNGFQSGDARFHAAIMPPAAAMVKITLDLRDPPTKEFD